MLKKTSSLLAFLCLISFSIKAQQLTNTTNENLKRGQAVFFELLGPGGIYSFNYDTRFNKTAGGLGIRTGVSYTKVNDASLFTVPVQLNYLLGKNEKFFEIGLGATYGTAEAFTDDIEGDDDNSGSALIGTMIFGYRKQPIDGGFMFRAGFSPIFNKNAFIPYWPYLSVGYSF